QYQAALQLVTYFNSSDNPSSLTRTIKIGRASCRERDKITNVVTATISYTAVNDAPVLDAHSGSLSYTENQAATAIDTVITAFDVDSASLAGATVTITGNFVAGQDFLGFTNQNGSTGNYTASLGVLTLNV